MPAGPALGVPLPQPPAGPPPAVQPSHQQPAYLFPPSHAPHAVETAQEGGSDGEAPPPLPQSPPADNPSSPIAKQPHTPPPAPLSPPPPPPPPAAETPPAATAMPWLEGNAKSRAAAAAKIATPGAAHPASKGSPQLSSGPSRGIRQDGFTATALHKFGYGSIKPNLTELDFMGCLLTATPLILLQMALELLP